MTRKRNIDESTTRQKADRDLTKRFRSEYNGADWYGKYQIACDKIKLLPDVAILYDETGTVFDRYLMFKAHQLLGHVSRHACFWEEFKETPKGGVSKIKEKRYEFTSEQIEAATAHRPAHLWLRDAAQLAVDQLIMGQFDVIIIYQMEIGYKSIADVFSKYNALFFSKGYTFNPALFTPRLVEPFIDEVITFFTSKLTCLVERYNECCEKIATLISINVDDVITVMEQLKINPESDVFSFNLILKSLTVNLYNIVHTLNHSITDASYNALMSLKK